MLAVGKNILNINLPRLCATANAVQAGHTIGTPPWDSHTDAAGDHQCSVAVHQDPQAAGPVRTRVHQL